MIMSLKEKSHSCRARVGISTSSGDLQIIKNVFLISIGKSSLEFLATEPKSVEGL